MDFTQFDFEKFERLCNENTNGLLYLRDKDSYAVLERYINETGIKCSHFVRMGSYIWYYRGIQEVCDYDSVEIKDNDIIYKIEDFLLAVPFNTKDILGFLEV